MLTIDVISYFMRMQRLDREGKLNSNAGQRLNLGLAAFGAGTIASSIVGLGILQTAGGTAAAVVAGATLGVCSALQMLTWASDRSCTCI